ncbi:hypothetical protein HPB51_027602 [Rhipicephalus microplus]|uniref:Ionotropic glutamate receptor C-terminal domain-containing protein n=1 Tax=Rhipicephalus microplus TaxID=6941 RepID=A0A9J6CZT6_RHIMP|nr:hypothetical protein HPB51_027602 [Rhipicephalus microplus]
MSERERTGNQLFSSSNKHLSRGGVVLGRSDVENLASRLPHYLSSLEASPRRLGSPCHHQPPNATAKDVQTEAGMDEYNYDSRTPPTPEHSHYQGSSPTAERNEVGEPSDILWYEDFIIVGGFSKDAVVQQTSITSSFSVFGEEVRIIHQFATAMRPRNQSSRIMIAFWCLAMLVTTNLFTAKMKAALTVRDQTNQRVDSAAELAERNGMTVYMAAETAYPKLLSISPRDYDRKVYRMLKPTSFLTYRQLFSMPVLDEVAVGKAVLLIDRTTATYELASFCQHYPDNEFYISRDRFFLNPLAVYYSPKRDVVIRLMKKWEKRQV